MLPDKQYQSERIEEPDQQVSYYKSLLWIGHTTAFHDRYMIIDKNSAYHTSASIKDAENKCFGIIYNIYKCLKTLRNNIAIYDYPKNKSYRTDTFIWFYKLLFYSLKLRT